MRHAMADRFVNSTGQAHSYFGVMGAFSAIPINCPTTRCRQRRFPRILPITLTWLVLSFEDLTKVHRLASIATIV
jgi:hypothetical protein